jgi:hypothetical protein
MTEETKRNVLTLQQKFVKLREAIPSLTQKAHSDGVKYKFAKIFDVYALLTPAMNQYGVNFDIVGETATRHDANGNPEYYHSYTQQTRSGSRTVWVYEADLTVRWTNADEPADFAQVTLHAIGTNDGGPDKAKGSAWTYCLKYYLFEKFGIDQGEDDPDMSDRSNDGAPAQQNRATAPRSGAGGKTTAFPAQNEAQAATLYCKGSAAGYTRAQIDDWLGKRYKQPDPRRLTPAQCEEACAILDEAAEVNKEEKRC